MQFTFQHAGLYALQAATGGVQAAVSRKGHFAPEKIAVGTDCIFAGEFEDGACKLVALVVVAPDPNILYTG